MVIRIRNQTQTQIQTIQIQTDFHVGFTYQIIMLLGSKPTSYIQY